MEVTLNLSDDLACITLDGGKKNAITSQVDPDAAMKPALLSEVL